MLSQRVSAFQVGVGGHWRPVAMLSLKYEFELDVGSSRRLRAELS